MLTTIAFDADDTLWKNNAHFNTTEDTFISLLEEYSTSADLKSQLLETERRNLEYYGFGVKGFTLSMIETAIEVTQGRVPTAIIAQMLDLGRELLRYPIELYPEVREVLQELQDDYTVMLITKGDLLDQERKIAQSGLGDLFDHVEIVSEKTKDVYQGIFNRIGVRTESTMMIGNSIRSDIIPALEIGAYGVLIPNTDEWEFENEGTFPVDMRRFFEIERVSQLRNLLAKIKMEC